MKKSFKYLLSLLLLVFGLNTDVALANTWYFSSSNHTTLGSSYKWLRNPYGGFSATYTVSGNWTGERIISNGASSNKWATTSFGSNVNIPAGTWTFNVYGSTTSGSWYPRIKIYDSSGSLIDTTTSPSAISGSSYMSVSWTDSVPAFSVGSGNYYAVEVYSYHTSGGYRTDNLRISTSTNYIIDTYGTVVYAPKSQGWHWYDDETSLTPGIALAGENVTPTGMYNHNQVRLRETIAEIGGGSQVGRRKMQYSSDSINFTDVGAIGSGAVWAYCNGGGTDDSLVSSLLVSTSSTFGPYVENGTAASTFNLAANSEAEFDFCLQENFALVNTTYYFRVYDVATSAPILPDATYNWPTITISDHTSSLAADANFLISAINMDSAPGPATGTFSNLAVKDYRGSLAGWSVTATATNLISGGNTIPITNLTMTPATISAVYAESTAGITLGGGALSTSIPINIATASTNNGAGNFIINGNFSLDIPLATVPGTYTSTLTLTLA